MLFESGENPKIIQALLGHKEVSTTLTVYNSVDKTYFKQATSRLNDLFNQEYTNAHKNIALPSKVENKEEEKPVKMIEDDDQLQIEMLEKLLKEKRLKMQKYDIEM
jgi:Na+-transporting NADH:ubiquinone oxidoreductase subunit NqrC